MTVLELIFRTDFWGLVLLLQIISFKSRKILGFKLKKRTE